MKRLISAALSIGLCLSCLIGCNGNNSGTGTGTNNTDKTIRFLNFKPEIASVYQDISEEYKKETGVTVVVETAASGSYEETLKAKMGTTDQAPTIFQINGPKGYISWKDYCADLTDTKLYEHLTDKTLAVKSGDRVYGIPYVVEGYGIIYNNAIMDKYFSLTNKATDVDSVDDIDSFSELKAVVEDMQKNKDKLGIKGVFASTSLKSGEDWRWQTHLANIPVSYEFRKKNVDLTSDQIKTIDFDYAANFKNTFDLYINNSTTDKKMLGTKIVDDSMAEFALGECAMVQNGNWGWSQIKGISGNKVKESDIKLMPIYTGMDDEGDQGLCIGTENFICINKKATTDQQKMAEDFLWWLYSSDKGRKFVTDGLGFIAPFDTFSESEVPSDPLAKEVVRYMKSDKYDNIAWNFTVFPSQTFKTEFGAALLQYAQGTKDWNYVKDLFVTKWKAESNA